MGQLTRTLQRYRSQLEPFVNLVLCLASYLLALLLRFDFNLRETLAHERLWLPLALLLVFRQCAYIRWQVNRTHWRYTSTVDLRKILVAHTASSICFAAAIGLLRVPGFPRSVFLIEYALSMLLAGGSRLAVRMLLEQGVSSEALRKAVILGAGDSGHLIVKFLLSSRRFGYQPVAVLDDVERLWSSSVHGVPVAGPLSYLERYLLSAGDISAVICAIPTLAPTRFASIEAICHSHGITFKKLQSFEDIALLGVKHESTSIEVMLERDVQVEHEEEISSALAGKKILVTGAGGSIGSEIIRQLMRFEPPKIVCLERNEFNLYAIRKELSGIRNSVDTRFVLGDIADRRLINRLLLQEAPDIVFHTAAYKHVPIVEENCYEAFVNNIAGTKTLLESSVQHGIKRFVFISTDKAVDPVNVLGFSKRIAESLVWSFSHVGHRGLNTSVVRFGNVINSSGSVIPLFKEQILSGGPLTVTDPEVERYFMSIREAVRLVLMAGVLGKNGDIYVLDMGQPLKIADVARKMLQLYGREDIPIVFTGLRPGEKLTEQLIDIGEQTSPTRFNKIERLIPAVVPLDVLGWVNEVESRLDGLDESQLWLTMSNFARLLTGRIPQKREEKSVGNSLLA